MDANRLVIGCVVVQGPIQIRRDRLVSPIDVFISESPVCVFSDVAIAVKDIHSRSSPRYLNGAKA